MKPGDRRKESVFPALGSPPRKEELVGLHEANSDRCFSNEGRIDWKGSCFFVLSVLCALLLFPLRCHLFLDSMGGCAVLSWMVLCVFFALLTDKT